jgi:hypothetical protein
MRRIFLGSIITASLMACGSEAGHPMGGPYGGDGTEVAPNNGGSGSGTSDGGSAESDGGQGVVPGIDSGTVNPGVDAGGGKVDAGSQPPPPGKDSGTSPPPPPPPPPPSATWTSIHNKYLVSSLGHCQDCHSSFSSPSSSYSYLRGKGYITGTASPLVDPNQSCLTWYGGNMPKNATGPQPQAVADMNAWAADGALNN